MSHPLTTPAAVHWVDGSQHGLVLGQPRLAPRAQRRGGFCPFHGECVHPVNGSGQGRVSRRAPHDQGVIGWQQRGDRDKG